MEGGCDEAGGAAVEGGGVGWFHGGGVIDGDLYILIESGESVTRVV